MKNRFKKMDTTQIAYKNIRSDEQFRENYRFVFSAAVIATFFVIPDNHVLWVALKWGVGASALFAAFFLVMSAAAVRYSKPYTMYAGIIPINDKIRRVMYDTSISVFGVFFLMAIGLIIIALVFEGFKNWTATLPDTWPLAICWLLILYNSPSCDCSCKEDVAGEE